MKFMVLVAIVTVLLIVLDLVKARVQQRFDFSQKAKVVLAGALVEAVGIAACYAII